MELTVSKNTLRDALLSSSHFTSSKFSSTPILQGILFSVRRDSLSLTSTNLSGFFCTQIPAVVAQEGSVVVESRTLLDFLGLLETEDVTLILRQGVLIIHKGKVKGSFATFEASDFPQPPIIEGKEYLLAKDTLLNINSILFSSSKDESRPHLTGINLSVREDKTYLATTDGFRLSVATLSGAQNYPSVTIAASVFSEVIRLGGEKEVKIIYSPTTKTIKFILPNTEIYSQIIEGDFPAFEKVIPESTTTKITLKKDEFLQNIKIAAVFTRNQSSVMIFEISEQGVVIRPKEIEGKGAEAFCEVEEFSGNKLKIAFNYRFVLEFLANTRGDRIVMEATQSTAPCIFRSQETKNLVHVIMPLRTEETTS